MSSESVFARPISKKISHHSYGYASYDALPMLTGGYYDYAASEILAAQIEGKSTPEPHGYTKYLRHFNFPNTPMQALAEVALSSTNATPINISPTSHNVQLSEKALTNTELPNYQLTAESWFPQGVRLDWLLRTFAHKEALTQARIINNAIKPGFDRVFIKKTRISPSVHQIKTLRTASTDIVENNAGRYISMHGLQETDVELFAKTLLRGGSVPIITQEESLQLAAADIYNTLRTVDRKIARKPYIHFLRQVYKKFLDQTTSDLIGTTTTVESLIVAMHEGQYLQVPLPVDITAAQKILETVVINPREVLEFGISDNQKLTLPIEQIADVMRKMPKDTIAQSPVLQLYAVLLASVGYDSFDKNSSPIVTKDEDGYIQEQFDISKYVASVSAWPDHVIGAVNKSSATWKELVQLEYSHVKNKMQIADKDIDALIEKRLTRLFGTHMLNVQSMSTTDLHAIDIFLRGLAQPIPESQLIFYERKAKFMVNNDNNNKAHFSLNSPGEGIIESEDYFFPAGTTLAEKNAWLPGIRDSMYAVAAIDQLYRSLGQIESLRESDRPTLNWNESITLLGSIAYLPIINKDGDEKYYLDLKDTYGIEPVSYNDYLDSDEQLEVIDEIGETLGKRLTHTNLATQADYLSKAA